jgi:hypothetical protein
MPTYTQSKNDETIYFSKIVLTVFVPKLRYEPLRDMARIDIHAPKLESQVAVLHGCKI